MPRRIQFPVVLLIATFIGNASSLSAQSPRRSFLTESTQAFVAGVSYLASSQPALAAITDETTNFAADTWWTGSENQSSASSSSAKKLPATTSASKASDEVNIYVSKQELQLRKGLGLELSDIEFRSNLRVYIKTIEKGSLASDLGIQKDWVIVAINGQSTERTNAQGVAQMLSAAVKASSADDLVELRFRDPSVFRNQLNQMEPGNSVTTQVAPAGDTTQRNADGSVKFGESVRAQTDQKLTVTQLQAPRLCNRGATTDDLLEISYIGRVLETGAIFDGSAVKIDNNGIPGRGDDVSLYFVLGKQPFGQFPPGWDVGMVGMCVGERRRLVIPPALAYGSKGLPRRGIPPDSTLQYDVTLLSINGLATPQ